MEKEKIRVGYASLVWDLPQAKFKVMRLKNYSEEKLRELIAFNLDSLNQITDYNIKHGIKMFRLSSSLIPFGSLPINTLDWAHEFSDEIKLIKDKLIEHDIRISIHPGQYTVLNSKDPQVVDNAILDLEYHVDVLEAFGGTRENKMILHIGGVYGDKKAATERFIEVANSVLSSRVRKHLILENDERSYSAKEVYDIAKATALPMVFDNLHHAINPSFENLSDQEIIKHVSNTWSPLDGRPKIHYSQQDPSKRPGAHSRSINLKIFQDFYSGVEADIMLEVKDKTRSTLKVNLLLEPDQKILEQEWARYKYLVMSKSYKNYSQIRQLFSNNQEVDVLEFYSVVDEALELESSQSQEIVALEHVWGYFKKRVDEKTKKQFLLLLENYKNDKISLQRIKTFLYNLAKKEKQEYLLQAYYFND